jgi:CheY-like chemotaxis protein/HPt (histidine-containing phosphotransfer) domain-containing protein/anti-sigma regulatory factor (Ser/Thr protein kinase)
LRGLRLRPTLSAAQRRRAEITETSARSLLGLINDVLDFSKMEAGRHVLHPCDCEVHQLVQNRVELLAVKAHAKQLEIAYRVAPEVPAVVHTDADRLTQVLTNLLSNAVKFTEQGEVVVSVSVASRPAELAPNETMLRFEVRDTGPGIDPAQHDRLFKSFSQVDASSTRAHEGTGLGLAISKHLVEMMGGEIGVQSEPGNGSTFWFTIRCPVVQQAQDPYRTAGSPHGRRILIADPNHMYREVLVEYATRWGMLVSTAATGEQALASAKEAAANGTPFDFAVVDLKLQGAQGGPLSAALKQDGGAQLSLIQLTPALWTPQEARGGEEGVFLTKPVRASELYDCIVNRSSDGMRSTGRLLPRGERKGHVLVVDDNEVNRVLAEELLHELGHTCDLVPGGREAVERVASRVYDVVLMDCQMPGMNGYQATHEIRELEVRLKRRTPIIALTAHAVTGEAQRVKAAGMDDFLSKPVAPRLLESTLQKWMAATSTGRLRSVPAHDLPDDSQVMTIRSIVPANDGAGQALTVDDPAAGEPVLGERRRSQRLIETFLRIVPEQVVELVQASSGSDLNAIRERAHKLKGSAASVGAMRMSKLCEAIQHGAERAETASLAGWAARVAEELVEVRAQLEAQLGAKQAGS